METKLTLAKWVIVKFHFQKIDFLIRGVPSQSDTFRCREGIAFIEKGSFASTIHCVSEEPIFSPNVGGLISEFEERMIVCNPNNSRLLPFRPNYLCREDEWLNGEYCEPHTLCSLQSKR